MLERRTFFTVALVAALTVTGCVSAPAESGSTTGDSPENTTPSTPSTTTDTVSPHADTVVEWPEGPKERPDRPAELNESSVRRFVKTHEYRYAYNTLWYGPETDVTLSCEVHEVSPDGEGYEVTVSCTGYSNTMTVAEEGGTPVKMHADYFTQTYSYYVDSDSIVRTQAAE